MTTEAYSIRPNGSSPLSVHPLAPTLADDPRAYLSRRAARLVLLIDLKVPTIIVENEFRLIEQAMVAMRRLEGDKRSDLDRPS